MSKIFAIASAIFGIIFAFTFGELVTALINRYSTYPAGTDTSMLATYFLLALLFISLAFLPAVWIVRKNKMAVLMLGLIVLFIWWLHVIPSFVPNSWCRYELKIYPCASDVWQGN
jgi:hypothetical protein